MDKNKIKSFAIWARKSLISAVSEKANRIGIYENNIEKAQSVQGGFKLEGKDEIFSLSNSHRDALVNKIREKGFEEVMEEVAYTWFNRFMGLRYMEVNDYLPIGVRILSSEIEDKSEPDALTKVFSLIDDLNLDINKVENLISDTDENGNIKTTTQKHIDRRELYKYLIIRQCNELGKIIPQMFEKISDYTELLLPDNLLEEGSVIRKMVEDIEEADWKEEVEIIGWMYQYYISEKKDEVFAALKKNVKITKENIPAATQLFTPKWIVKYMVENSLGRLWLEKLSVDSGQWALVSEELKSKWKYYLEEAEQEPEVEEELKKIRGEHAKLKPEDIKVLDPCMGSGHILVYAFDVLYEIYKTAGYSEREIPRMILQNNLYALDIDDRAAQLASFALIMKARSFNRRLFREIEREHLELNLCSIQESNEISEQLSVDSGQLIDYFVGSGQCLVDSEKLRADFEYLVNVFIDAKEYGSILEVEKVNLEALKQRLKEIENDDNLIFADYRKMILYKLPMLIKQAEIMEKKYDVCITNPPYLSDKGMSQNLTNYLKSNYKISKADLFTVYMEVCNRLSKNFYSMINQHTWMFISTFEKLRLKVYDNETIVNMIHLGPRAFEEISGEVVQSTSFVNRISHLTNYKGSFIRLTNMNTSSAKEKQFLKANNGDISNRFDVIATKFKNIPTSPVCYWATRKIEEIFSNNQKIGDIAEPRSGLSTTDNNRFVREWYEVEFNKIGFGMSNRDYAKLSLRKWFPYNKGGSYRKWYGNQEYVVNWEDDGREIRKNAEGASGGRIVNPDFYFNESITWSKISTTKLSLRYLKNGYVFDVGGTSIFGNTRILKYLIGFLNSTLSNEFIKYLSQTINFEVGNLKNMPIILRESDEIVNLVNNNINISKNDWDSFETSWDFKIHPLLKLLDRGEQHSLSAIFRIWETECEENFEQLKHNEEELNRIFIDIYGLQDELTPEVEDKDITIRKADIERDIKSLISYAVGCMFGRYSIDSEGLIYAGGEFSDKWLVSSEQCKVRKIVKDDDGNVISDSWVDANFMPDIDNIIPITEDEYFEDDIVSRFIDFVRTVYGEETLEENLDFIADSIGRKASETARQAIRRYFIKDFYKDHLKVYQKRPIYWMFDSGKNDGFKALIYMHRYNEQTVAKVRTDYLHTLQRKYESEINRLKLVVDSEEYTAKDRTAAKKKIARISKQLEECKEYDQVVAHLANEKISIDLDDGVKVNYAKFQGVKLINSKEKEVIMNLLTKI